MLLSVDDMYTGVRTCTYIDLHDSGLDIKDLIPHYAPSVSDKDVA